MKQLWIAVLVAGTVAVAGAQNKTPNQSQNSSNRPRRVAMHVGGFDLAPGAASANQIGGASRGVSNSGPVLLYAPHKGQAYTLRPSFWWQGDANAKYKFHLQDLQGGISWDREVTGTSMAYPSDAPPLTPGHTYLWRIESESSLFGPPAPSAVIVVLPAAERAQIKAEEAKFKGSSEQDAVDRAQVFYNHRLWYDTLGAYDKLIARYPADAKLVKMRDELYEQLPATRKLAAQDMAHSR
ncbi:MAG: DUF928 domain-containing protein [Acidobacteriaceae bacterium]